eukprot:3174455-Pleurochrysis_carterae.AAC.1
MHLYSEDASEITWGRRCDLSGLACARNKQQQRPTKVRKQLQTRILRVNMNCPVKGKELTRARRSNSARHHVRGRDSNYQTVTTTCMRKFGSVRAQEK